jgi:hypothetical protein
MRACTRKSSQKARARRARSERTRRAPLLGRLLPLRLDEAQPRQVRLRLVRLALSDVSVRKESMPRQRSLGSVLFTRVCVCVWKGAARTACVSFQWRSSARVFSIASLRACATSAATHTHENTRATRRRANPRATPRAPRARSRPAAPPRPPRCARAPLAARQLLRRVRVHVSSLHGGLARRVWVGRFDEPSDRGRRFRLLILLPPRAGAARARAALLVVAGVAVLLAAALLAVLCRVWVRAFGVRRRVSAGAAVRTERA